MIYKSNKCKIYVIIIIIHNASLKFMFPFSVCRLASAWSYSWFRHAEATTGEIQCSCELPCPVDRMLQLLNSPFEYERELIFTHVRGVRMFTNYIILKPRFQQQPHLCFDSSRQAALWVQQ